MFWRSIRIGWITPRQSGSSERNEHLFVERSESRFDEEALDCVPRRLFLTQQTLSSITIWTSRSSRRFRSIGCRTLQPVRREFSRRRTENHSATASIATRIDTDRHGTTSKTHSWITARRWWRRRGRGRTGESRLERARMLILARII